MDQTFDAIVVGSGPGGSVCAMQLARAGFSVCVLEKTSHPRFHIGESILPRTNPLLKELGLYEKVMQLPHLPKNGAEFGFGDNPITLKFGFADGLLPGFPIFNIERSIFDDFLAGEARDAGAIIMQNTPLQRIVKLEDGNVEVIAAGKTLRAKVLMDASGHGTVVARHLGTRKMLDDNLQRVAYFEHFENVERLTGQHEGHPSIIMSDEGWFWLIGLNETTTSIGFVARPELVKQINIPANKMLRWAIDRCPVVRDRMKNSTGPDENEVLADFSYTCKPYAGPGYFLVGDAACFLDPIFSTGVTLAMMGANEAAKLAVQILRTERSPKNAQRAYRKFVLGSTGIFWSLIRGYYNHNFRELFMNGQGPCLVHRAVISILAGQVFPKPVWALRWRLWLFRLCVFGQRFYPLCPRHPHFSLPNESPVKQHSGELVGAN